MLRQVPDIKVFPRNSTFKLAIYNKFNQGIIHKSVSNMKGKERAANNRTLLAPLSLKVHKEGTEARTQR